MEKFKWCFIGTGTLAKNVARQIGLYYTELE